MTATVMDRLVVSRPCCGLGWLCEPEHRRWPRGKALSCCWGLARERHVVYMRMDDMRPACVDTCGSVRHGPREGMMAQGHMHVDKGRWTCPDLVKLKAEKLEWRN